MTVRPGIFVRDNTTDGVTSAQDARLALAGLLSGAGILSGFQVTGSSSGPDLIYTIAAGHVATARGTIAADGLYLFDNDGPVDKDSGVPAPSSGTRFDLIWVLHKNAFSSDGFGDADSTPEFGVTVGVAGASPVKPYASVPAGALVLAESSVPTNAPNAASAVITMVADQVTAVGVADGPRGIVAPPVGTADNGTAATGGTEWRDAVLGNYAFTAVAGRRYRVILAGRAMNASVAGEAYEFRIRDGGAGTPGPGATLVAAALGRLEAASIPGRMTVPVSGTFTASGPVTLAAFMVRITATGGTGTPVPSPSGLPCEFYVEDVGGV